MADLYRSAPVSRVGEKRPIDAVESRPQPSPQKNDIVNEMTAGRAVSFFGTPQSADQGDYWGLQGAYEQAQGGTADQ
jgi:hypothetical protein